MGISHDYHSTGRSRRGGPGGVIRFAGAVAGILLVSFAITAILEHGQAQPEELPMKGNLARQLFLSHPELKQELWGGHLWNPSYYAVTVSDRSREQVSAYIEGQKEKEKRKP